MPTNYKPMIPKIFLHLILVIISLSNATSTLANEIKASQTKLQTSAKRKPNVIVILSDDQGWGDLSFNGNTNLATPNIDKLAKSGASFERFFVCPVCSPTRAEFLTGRYHARCGVYSTSAGGERMNLDEVTIADTFKAAGYRTAAFGKWHNGMQYPYHPNGRGFDEFYGFCSGHWGNYFDPMLERNGKIIKGNGFVIDDFTNQLMDFVQQNKDQPFFAYLPLNTPHSPMQVPDRWWNKFKAKALDKQNRNPEKEKIGHTRAALAMCENIDWNVGRILQKLKELSLDEDTIVVYFCDNGPNGVRWNGDMKGRKGSTDEGGVRSPLFISWPGKINSGKSIPQISSVTDLLPTLTELCEIPSTSKKKLDGISFRDELVASKTKTTKTTGKLDERIIFSHWANRVSIRTQKYRYDNKGALFDLTTDPGQRNNISSKNPRLVKQYREAVSSFRKDILAGYNIDNRPFVLGHADYERTQIPARDGKAHGKIKRSNRFPNCSFFTNWKSINDKITWDVDVGKPGTYLVDLYYTCKPENVGVELELSCSGSRIQKKIEKPHDPQLIGAQEDRVPRIESYVKEFKVIRFGEIQLKEGSSELKLKATRIPGDAAIDFRLLMFTRK